LPRPIKHTRKNAKIGGVCRKEHDEVDNKGRNCKERQKEREPQGEQWSKSNVSIERFMFLFHVA